MMDRRGGMGFVEAMLAVMAVTVVLMMYMSSVATAVLMEADPVSDLDPEQMTAEVVDRRIEVGFEDYLEGFVSEHGINGAAVMVTVPGGFADGPYSTVLGTSAGEVHSRTFSGNIPADHGRTVSAVFEVTLWT